MKTYAKKSFYENINGLIALCKTTDSKAYWKLTKQLNNKSDNFVPIPSLFGPQKGELVFEDNDKGMY